MGQPIDTAQMNFTGGEISPGALGRFDMAKYANSVKTMENWIPKQLGGAFFRPGTRYVAGTKSDAVRSRLLKFFYSTEQNYAIEAGNLYFRFFTKDVGGEFGQLVSGVTPVELVTVFETANLRKIKYTQNADTMYLFTGVYPVQKLTRTSATTFTITQVDFVRGPFLDSNITSTTIDPSADTGAGITLTASSAIFLAGHVGSFWRVKNGVVKITAFTSTTLVTGTVQAEPDGTAGNLGTGGTPDTDWAEGAFSAVRGYPSCGVFHDGRLFMGNTTYQKGGLWGSNSFEYENMDVGNGDDNEAIVRELDGGGEGVPDIRWLSSGPKNLQAGTSAGPFSITSGNQGIALTPANITATKDSAFGTADIQARRMWNFVYYAQNNLKRILEAGYFFDVDQNDVGDTQLMADHILETIIDDSRIFRRGDEELGGAYDLDTQQSPNNRLWVVRDDGQIAVLTRNPRQEVNGWCRIILGATISCDGKSGSGLAESITILPQDGGHDIIVIIANRVIDGVVKRFVEYFTEEDFKYHWEPVRLDCSLTYDEPIEITDISLSPVVLITAPGHGLLDGDQIRLDNIVGAHQLNAGIYLVTNSTVDTFEIAEVS